MKFTRNVFNNVWNNHVKDRQVTSQNFVQKVPVLSVQVGKDFSEKSGLYFHLQKKIYILGRPIISFLISSDALIID
jgi:hypothetical protein